MSAFVSSCHPLTSFVNLCHAAICGMICSRKRIEARTRKKPLRPELETSNERRKGLFLCAETTARAQEPHSKADRISTQQPATSSSGGGERGGGRAHKRKGKEETRKRKNRERKKGKGKEKGEGKKERRNTEYSWLITLLRFMVLFSSPPYPITLYHFFPSLLQLSKCVLKCVPNF